MPALRDCTAWATAVCLAMGVAGRVEAKPPGEGPAVLVWPVAGEDTGAADPAVRERGFRPFAAGPLAHRLETARQAEVERERDVLDDAERMLEEAQRAYLEQRWDDVTALLDGIEREAMPVIGARRHCQTLWELQFRRWLALRASAGEAPAARDRLRLAVFIDPLQRPVRELYGPDVVQDYLAEVESVRSDPARPIALKTTPRDATVTIDCREVSSEQPVTLVPGLHVVHVAAAGRAARAVVVDTRTVASVSIEAVAEEGSITEAWGRSLVHGPFPSWGPSSMAALGEAARESGADAAIAVGGSGSAVVARAVGADGKLGRRLEASTVGEAVRRAIVDLDDAANIRLVTPGLTSSVELGPGRVTVGRRGPVRRPGLWIGVGVGLAVALGLGLGLGLGLRPQAQPAPDLIRIVAPSG